MWINKQRILCILFIYLVLIETCACFIFESCVVVAIGALAWKATSYYNSYHERQFSNSERERQICNSDRERRICASVNLDYDGLSKDLKTKLYGQHLVSKAILTHLKGHFKDQNPGKPLVLSLMDVLVLEKTLSLKLFEITLTKELQRNIFISSTLRFTSKTINHSILLHTRFVSFYDKFDSSNLFAKMSMQLSFNKTTKKTYTLNFDGNWTGGMEQLYSWVYHNVSTCARSMFVFDEMDHMPNGLLNTLTPFLEHNDNLDRIDFRKAVFIFLSNSGSVGITKGVSEHINAGNNRSSLTMKQMQKMLSSVAYNEQGGFKNSKLIKKRLVDHFIPFLPLEREHVSDCVRDMVRQKYDITIPSEKINEVLDQMEWKTKDKSTFASYGCKNIETHVRAMAEDILEDEEDDKHEEL